MFSPRAITHYKVFNETELLLSSFYKTIRDGLQEKLGAVLFQFFANVQYSEEFLSKVIDQLDPSFTNVLEFRHASWWQPEVFERLARQNIIFSGMSHPQLPNHVIVNSQTVYYRFHGVPKLYYSSYPRRFLRQVMEEIKSHAGLREAFLYFNNTAEGAAIKNAKYLLQEFVIRQNKG